MRKNKIIDALVMTSISFVVLGFIHNSNGQTNPAIVDTSSLSKNDSKLVQEIPTLENSIANVMTTANGQTKNEIGVISNLPRTTNKNSVSRGSSLKANNIIEDKVVDELQKETIETPKKKNIEIVAEEVINGKYGNGEQRKQRLEEEGYDYNEIQKEVAKILPKPPRQQAKVSRGSSLGGKIIKAQSHRDFKSYMPCSALSKNSPQGRLCAKASPDVNTAILMYEGRYLVALGFAYAGDIGTKIDVIMESGQVIPVIVGDWKATNDTNNNSTDSGDGSIIEFIVSSNRAANKAVNGSGSYNYLFPGKVKEFIKY